MIESLIFLFANIYIGRTPHIKCSQIGDNRYDCTGYWTD
jgi:hypothetical protein